MNACLTPECRDPDCPGLSGGRCPMAPEVDQNGVEFSRNCVTARACKKQNLCYGTCKLF